MMDKNLLVAQIIDVNTLILNKGRREGICIGQEYIVYRLGDEIIDPETKECLGRWEIVRGRGEIINVDEKFSVLRSVNKGTGLIAFSLAASGKSPYVPFNDPEVGDFAKLVKNDIKLNNKKEDAKELI